MIPSEEELGMGGGGMNDYSSQGVGKSFSSPQQQKQQNQQQRQQQQQQQAFEPDLDMDNAFGDGFGKL